jgi:hypothetical protein
MPTLAGSTPNAGTGYVHPTDIEYDRGHCDSDRRHITNATVNYEIGRVGTGALSAVASGWRLSGIVRATSGRWLNVTVTGDPARTAQAGQRPNRVLDDPYGDKSLNNYLNPAAFAQPALGTYGDLPRNAVEGPGRWSIDASLVQIRVLATEITKTNSHEGHNDHEAEILRDFRVFVANLRLFVASLA